MSAPAEPANADRAPPEQGAFRRFLPLVVVALGMAAVFGSGAHRYVTLEALLEYRDRLEAFVAAHRAKALAGYMLVYVTVVALSIPGAVLLTTVGGFLFGWAMGAVAAVIAATVGAILIYLIARSSVGDALLRRAGPRVRSFAEGFRDDAFAYLLFVRILPVVPFWVTNLAAALFGVPLRTFALATLIGIVPATLTFAVAGSGLDSVVEAQRQAQAACRAAGGTGCGFEIGPAALLTPKTIAALVGLGLMSLLPVLVKRYRRSRARTLGDGRAEA